MTYVGRKKYRIKGRFYLFVVIFAVLLAILISYIVKFFDPPMVKWGRLDSDIAITALIVRNEIIIYTDAYADISSKVAEGEYVKQGDEVAVLYMSGYSHKDRENLSELQQNIKRQQDVILQKSVVDKNMDNINDAIEEMLHSVSKKVSEQDTRNLLQYQRELSKRMAMRKDYTYEVVKQDTYLEQLYISEIELLDKISQYQNVLITPTDGIVSFFFDGCEGLLDELHMENLVASDVLDIKDSIIEGNIDKSELTGSLVTNKQELFRVIDANKWYALVVLTMSENVLVEGQSIEVTFESYEDDLLMATVSSVRTENRKVLIILEFDMPIKSMVSLRLVDGYIGKGEEGFKVPLGALQNILGEDGITVEYEGGEVFIPVTVLDTDDTQAIIMDAVFETSENRGDLLLETGYKVVMP